MALSQCPYGSAYPALSQLGSVTCWHTCFSCSWELSLCPHPCPSHSVCIQSSPSKHSQRKERDHFPLWRAPTQPGSGTECHKRLHNCTAPLLPRPPHQLGRVDCLPLVCLQPFALRGRSSCPAFSRTSQTSVCCGNSIDV